MAKQLFETFDRDDITDSMLREATSLFNGNYGIWGKDSTGYQQMPKQGELHKDYSNSCLTIRAGSRVKLGKDRLRAQCLPENVDCSYSKVTIEGCLAGNAFACRWKDNDKKVCWITQLVVHSDYRERGLAVGLLNCLRQDDDNMYGIMSSHPAACLAAAKAFGSNAFLPLYQYDSETNYSLGGIASISMDFIQDNASNVLKQSPVEYVRTAELQGKLFKPDDTTGAISSVDTNFFVDHTEPLEALQWIRSGLSWPLGELLDGHEFLLIIENRIRSRPRPRSA